MPAPGRDLVTRVAQSPWLLVLLGLVVPLLIYVAWMLFEPLLAAG